jgi:regulator of sirC expression with transglutaminase-like and TPR domain
MQDDATGKILAAQFFLSESAEGYFHVLHPRHRRSLRRSKLRTQQQGRGGQQKRATRQKLAKMSHRTSLSG